MIEFIEDTHQYLVEGIIVPSVTQILHRRFPDKYKYVDKAVLKQASEKGIAVHSAIEEYIKRGKESELPELRNYKFLEKMYKFKAKASEVPIAIYIDGMPVCAGRLDLVIESEGQIGGADIKRQSVIDKEMVAYQLNLYRIGYRQCFGKEWQFLRCIQLRDEIRRYHNIPICEELTMNMLKEVLYESKQ